MGLRVGRAGGCDVGGVVGRHGGCGEVATIEGVGWGSWFQEHKREERGEMAMEEWNCVGAGRNEVFWSACRFGRTCEYGDYGERQFRVLEKQSEVGDGDSLKTLCFISNCFQSVRCALMVAEWVLIGTCIQGMVKLDRYWEVVVTDIEGLLKPCLPVRSSGRRLRARILAGEQAHDNK